jgi:hypothetical protein
MDWLAGVAVFAIFGVGIFVLGPIAVTSGSPWGLVWGVWMGVWAIVGMIASSDLT